MQRWRREDVGIAAAGVALLLLVGALLGFLAFRDVGGDDGTALAPTTTEQATTALTTTERTTTEATTTAPPPASTQAGPRVPRVVGLFETPARSALEAEGYEVIADRQPSERPEGEVVAQVPRAGTRLASGSAVAIAVSSGVPPSGEGEVPVAESEVPGVLEIGFVDAANQVEARGFVADSFAVSSRALRGAVISQRPGPGTQLAAGRHVRLNVALGTGVRESARVPDVTGPKERRARDVARRAGFTTRTVDRDAPSADQVGVVLLQQPAAGTFAPVLTQIVLYVGRA